MAPFCYRCSKWFQSSRDWQQHCAWHLSNLNIRCDKYKYGYIHACATGFLSVRIGCSRLSPAARLHRFLWPRKLWKLVSKHLQMSSWPIPCPHSLCRLEIGDEESFDHHMVDTHGKYSLPPYHYSGSTKREIQMTRRRKSSQMLAKRNSIARGEQSVPAAFPVLQMSSASMT